MDIDKIQFGQLSAGKIDKSFEDLDVNNDGKINEQDKNLATNLEIKNAISQILASDVDEEPELDDDSNFDIDNLSETADTRHAELGSASQDSEIPKQVRNDVSSNTAVQQSQLATLSLQVQQLQKEQEDLQDELETKQKEQEKIEKEILVKQEEYEILAKEIENSQGKDPSKIARAEELGAEIKSLTTDFENLKSEITEIQGKSKNNSTQLQTLNTQIQALQSQTTQSVSQTNTVNNVGEVSEVSDVAEVNEATPTNAPTPTNKVEIKTMEEYVADINCKFDELWDKFGGDRDKITQYMKNNLNDYMDVTGNGKVDLIDYAIWDNYMKLYGTSGSKFREEQKTDFIKTYTKSRYFAQEIKKRVYQLTHTSIEASRCTSRYELGDHKFYIGSLREDCTYDLDDIENMIKLGVGYNILNRARLSLNINKIAQDEDWEAKLDTYCASAKLNWLEIKNLKEQISKAAEFINNNPENAPYGAMAANYSLYTKTLERPIGYNDDPEVRTYQIINNTVMNKLSEFCDFNADGKIDYDDLQYLNSEIDLDGDGCVSIGEKNYIKMVKKELVNCLYASTMRNGYYNNNNIDDVINNIDNVPQSLIDDYYNRAEFQRNDEYYVYVTEHNKEHPDEPAMSMEEYEDFLNKYLADGRHQHIVLRAWGPSFGTLLALNGLMDSSGKLLSYDEYKHTFGEDLLALSDKIGDMLQPANTYLHYVQSADLTKEELQEILNKINNASEYAQSQLAEVKSVVEQRLASM